MMFEIELLDSAETELKKLDKSAKKRLTDKIFWLAQNVETIIPQTLSGNLAGLFKLRTGDYRIIYEIIDEERLIMIHMVGHRRDVYKKLE